MDDGSPSLGELLAFVGASRDEWRKLEGQYLGPFDRDLIRREKKQIKYFTQAGALIGVGWGIFRASRRGSGQNALLKAFRAQEKPVAVVFANGRTEPMTPLRKPSILGKIKPYLLFSVGGCFLGGIFGYGTGNIFVRRKRAQHPETKASIEAAYTKIRAEAIRKNAEWWIKRMRESDQVLGAESVDLEV